MQPRSAANPSYNKPNRLAGVVALSELNGERQSKVYTCKRSSVMLNYTGIATKLVIILVLLLVGVFQVPYGRTSLFQASPTTIVFNDVNPTGEVGAPIYFIAENGWISGYSTSVCNQYGTSPPLLLTKQWRNSRSAL